MGDLNTNHKKLIPTIIITSLVALAAISAGALHALSGDSQSDSRQATASESSSGDVQSSTTVEFEAVKDQTVLQQLQDNAEVVVKDSQYGQYVDSINGVQGGTDNKYWTYYVDGQMANIGAGEYTTNGGEQITWKFE